ncbi:MAG: SsrA-binding protein [Clostridia bacterium]
MVLKLNLFEMVKLTKDSYANIKWRSICLWPHISPMNMVIYLIKTLRARKLLLNKKEINKLVGLINQKGYSLIPEDNF